MRVVKKSFAILLAMIIAVSAFNISYAENIAEEGTKEKTEIRMGEYLGITYLIVFSDVYIASFETINICQRDNESNEITLITSVSVEDNCYTYSDEPKEIFSIRIPQGKIFVPQGKYTLELIAKETTPEGIKKENNLSIDFEYEDIINPEIYSLTIDLKLKEGEETDIFDIISLPEDYLSVYSISETRIVSPYDSYVEINGSTIKGTARGKTLVVVEDRFSGQTIAEINLKIQPETPDNFFDLIGSTFEIIGSDSLDAFSSLFEISVGGITGLFYSVVALPVLTVVAAFGSIFGLIF